MEIKERVAPGSALPPPSHDEIPDVAEVVIYSPCSPKINYLSYIQCAQDELKRIKGIMSNLTNECAKNASNYDNSVATYKEQTKRAEDDLKVLSSLSLSLSH